MATKVNKNWYKFLSDAVEKQLNEITQKTIDKTQVEKFLSKKKSKQLPAIFENDDRIVIPFGTKTTLTEADRILLSYIDEVRKQGWTVDLSQPFGYATKIVEKEFKGQKFTDKKRVKIGPLIMALSPEASAFWQKNNKFYTTKENELYFNSDYAIVISRIPIDILRMSDHDGWTSCHATEGSYFKCAAEESVTGGAIAYIVKAEDLNKVNITSPEIFQDRERGIDGIIPLGRLRIRRFIGPSPYKEGEYTGDTEIGVPERRTYGQSFPGFKEVVNSFLMEKQKDAIQNIKELASENGELDLSQWTLFGGSYQDHKGEDLFEEFFGSEFDIYGTPEINHSAVEKAQFANQVEEVVTNHNNNSDQTSIYAEAEEYEGEEYVNYGGTIKSVLNFGSREKANEVLDNLLALKWRQKDDISNDLLQQYKYGLVSAGSNDIELDFRSGYIDGTIVISINIPGSGNTIEDLSDFANSLESYDSKIDMQELESNLLYILKKNGIIEDKNIELLNAVAGTLKNFQVDSPHTTNTGATAKSKIIPLGTAKTSFEQFYNLTRDIPDPAQDKLIRLFRDRVNQLIQTKILDNINKMDFKIKIRSIFLGQKHVLDRQRTIFHPTQTIKKTIAEERTTTGEHISNIDFHFDITNFYWEDEKISLSLNVDWDDPETSPDKTGTSIETYIQFLKFMDNMIPKIRDYVFNLYNEGFREILEEISKMVKEFDRNTLKQQYSDTSYRQQRLPGIRENKEKLFKLDGSTWRMSR